jgi:broad specificity phosphatase PhoE
MRTLLLIRHAQPEVMPGVAARDWPLAPAGRAAARALAGRLAGAYTLTRLTGSGEPKAMQTAQIIAQELRLPVEHDADLGEHRRERVPFLGAAAWDAAIVLFFASPAALVLGEETALQALERFSAAVARCVTRESERDVALVTHGAVMTLFVAAHNPRVSALAFWRGLALPDLVALALPDYHLITAGPLPSGHS